MNGEIKFIQLCGNDIHYNVKLEVRKQSLKEGVDAESGRGNE